MTKKIKPLTELSRWPDMGKEMTDKVTGFKGIAIGVIQNITGCDQVCIQPKCDKGKHVESRWIDVNRLDITKEKPVKIETDVVQGACCTPPAERNL